MVIFGFTPGHPLGCICLSFSVLLSGAKKIRSCGSCMVEEFVSDSWQNPSGYFSLVLFSLPVSIGFNGTGFVMAGFLRLSVHLRRSSSFMAFAHMVWRYSSRQRMAESFLVEQTLSSRCSLHGGYLSHVFFTLVLPSTLLSGHSIRIASYFGISEGGAISCLYCFLVGVY